MPYTINGYNNIIVPSLDLTDPVSLEVLGKTHSLFRDLANVGLSAVHMAVLGNSKERPNSSPIILGDKSELTLDETYKYTNRELASAGINIANTALLVTNMFADEGDFLPGYNETDIKRVVTSDINERDRIGTGSELGLAPVRELHSGILIKKNPDLVRLSLAATCVDETSRTTTLQMQSHHNGNWGVTVTDASYDGTFSMPRPSSSFAILESYNTAFRNLPAA